MSTTVRRFPANNPFEVKAKKTGLGIFEVLELATIPEMFNSLGINLDQVVVTKEQREEFVAHCNTRENTPAFVFLHKDDEFVATCEQFIGGKWFTSLHDFSCRGTQDGCYGGHGTWCVVVPLSALPK